MIALIGQHGFELAPTGILNRFRHFGFYQLETRYVSNEDRRILVDEFAAVFMQGICPAVLGFSVDRLNARLVFGALGNTELGFQGTILSPCTGVAGGIGRGIFAP